MAIDIDFLIVGQGLAGSLLAWRMLQNQYRVIVLDNGAENASQIAAGLINPVTGQRLVKTSGVEKFLPAAKQCYQNLNKELADSFFVETAMLRILNSQAELDTANTRLLQPAYQPYLQSIIADYHKIPADFGILPQKQTGYLRTRILLSELRKLFISLGCFRQTMLDYREIILQPFLQWRDIKPRRIVFCEGHRAVANPWFAYLPFQLAKGEILTAETESPLPEHIVHFGKWLIPLANGRFKTGATFDTEQIDEIPGSAARTQLLTALLQAYPQLHTFTLIDHKAGIRPATRDKHPFIGAHPTLKNLHIFNGFGSKGSLTIPWYCQHFIETMQLGEPLEKSCNINRYHDTYFPG